MSSPDVPYRQAALPQERIEAAGRLPDSPAGNRAEIARLTREINEGFSALASLSGAAAAQKANAIGGLAKQRYALELMNHAALIASAKSIKQQVGGCKELSRG
jgi:hypothetical protein